MIGKYFSNGWKIRAVFSNDWKNFSAVFQRLENFFGAEVVRQLLTITDNFERETTWTTRDNFFKVPGGQLRPADEVGRMGEGGTPKASSLSRLFTEYLELLYFLPRSILKRCHHRRNPLAGVPNTTQGPSTALSNHNPIQTLASTGSGSGYLFHK